MPLFEFVCDQCRQPFEELVRSASAVDQVVCPTCGSADVSKKLSTFASKITGSGSASVRLGSAASCSSGSV